MLKGILFVLAIIVTFDIGKTIIDHYRAERAQEQTQEALEQAAEGANDEGDSAGMDGEGTGEEAGEVRTLLDLSLPEGAMVDEHEEDGDPDSGQQQTNMFDESSSAGSTNKSMTIKTRPIVEFQTEERKPEVSGIKLELKKDL